MSSNYINSKKRFILLLAQLSIIVYTICNGDETAKLLALFITPLWIKAVTTWRT